jgi:hypothetical protein
MTLEIQAMTWDRHKNVAKLNWLIGSQPSIHISWLLVGIRVWRYQRGNHNPYIEEEQTTTCPKEQIQKDKQQSTKNTYKAKDRVTQTPLQTGELSRNLKKKMGVRHRLITSQIRLILLIIIYHLYVILIRKDMDVNEHERLSNITLRHKLKLSNSAFIAVLHFKAHQQ